jgi:Laminin EGF domain
MPRIHTLLIEPAHTGHALRSALAVRLVVLTAGLVQSCDSEGSAKVVQPAYPDPCRFFAPDSCSGNGECHADTLGEPVCLCAPGYGGVACDTCEDGFHRDARDLCISDRSCPELTGELCASVGVCRDDDGVISCLCARGYGGPRCTLCANDYARDVSGACAPDARGPRPGEPGPNDEPDEAEQCAPGLTRVDGQCVGTPSCMTTVAFEKGAGFPNTDNTCVAVDEMVMPQLSLHSRATEDDDPSYVWQCANFWSKFGLASQHVELEAGPTQTAEMVFPSPITSLRFDAAGSLTPLSVDVLANGVPVSQIEQEQYKPSEVTLEMTSPTTRVTLRSRTLYVQNIAIDNVSYRAANCE